jgi:hypothetical protein
LNPRASQRSHLANGQSRRRRHQLLQPSAVRFLAVLDTSRLVRNGERNQAVNPARSVKPRAREFWRESRQTFGRARFSGYRARTLAGAESAASPCVTGGKRKRPRASALGLLREPLGLRQFRKLKKLPVSNPLRNHSRADRSRKSSPGNDLLSSSLFRCQPIDQSISNFGSTG